MKSSLSSGVPLAILGTLVLPLACNNEVVVPGGKEPEPEGHQVNKPNHSQKLHTATASDTSANAVPSSSAQTSTLAEEVALLREVRAVLSTDPEAAKKLLQKYQERHPSGALRAEYEALAVRARAQQGAAE